MTSSRVANILDEERTPADVVRVGKDVIEILTSGMYVSPLSVYREYVQNAADSIDQARGKTGGAVAEAGKVNITIDHVSRTIVIRDDGAGIPSNTAVATLLAIGGSGKRGTGARGFRGVGRLCGLAYCRELEFRTKAKGESSITVVTWDCRALRARLSDQSYAADIRQIIADTVTTRKEKSDDRADHYFEVHLRDVARFRQDILLNEKLVSDYLAQVAPVPFSKAFSIGPQIQAKLTALGLRQPIHLTVSGQQICKLYQDKTPIPGTSNVVTIGNVEFVEFTDVDGKIGALAWLGHHEYTRSLPVGLGIRGLRGRVGDVQIGDSSLFDASFKEPRFNGWTIGELHIFDRRLVPNARRDDFELNHHYSNLLAQSGPLAARVTQICRTTSVSRNAGQIIQNVIDEIETALATGRKIDRAEVSRMRASLMRARAKLRSLADEKLRHRLGTKLDKLEVRLSSIKPARGPSVVAVNEALALVGKFVTNRAQAQKLVAALQQLSG